MASRLQGYVEYPGYAQPVYGPGCYWASQPVYDGAGRFVGYTGRPLQVCPGYVAPPPPGAAGLRRLLRPRQNDRVSRRIKSQRSSDKPPLGQRVASRRSGVRTSIARTESFANLQTCYERLWQSPSSNDKCNQRNNQNDVDDRRFQQFLFRV
jgi:hypothetical protein